jgi:hypothetical protein
MKSHILQAEHNTDFHKNICSNFPELYFDWKITVVFYTALHLLKALAKKNKKNIGNTHTEIFKNIRNSNSAAILPLSTTACNTYNDLYTYSHSVRYDGIGHLMDLDTWNKLKKVDHKVCETMIKNFILYMDKRGVQMS